MNWGKCNIARILLTEMEVDKILNSPKEFTEDINPGDANAWDKLQRALKAQIDPVAFEQMCGPVSFPFKSGEHRRIAVKVIDFRGNEVVRVMSLDKVTYESGRR